MKSNSAPRSRREIKINDAMSVKAVSIIANHYDVLKCELCKDLNLNCRGETEEDIFCNTIIFVIHETDISKKSESELLEHFKNRFKMLMFQTVRDEASIQKHLADNYHDVRNALYNNG